jgi:hypothetical protein
MTENASVKASVTLTAFCMPDYYVVSLWCDKEYRMLKRNVCANVLSSHLASFSYFTSGT